MSARIEIGDKLYKLPELSHIREAPRVVFAIRVHHLSILCYICQEDFGWEWHTETRPWEMDLAERITTAQQVAFLLSTRRVIDKILRRDELGVSQSTPQGVSSIQQINDYIGTSYDQAKLYQMRLYTAYFNFLTALYSATTQFPLTLEVDAICQSCIGNGSGAGAHCAQNPPPEKNADLLVLAQLHTHRNPEWISKKGGRFSIFAQAFFDEQFQTLVRSAQGLK